MTMFKIMSRDWFASGICAALAALLVMLMAVLLNAAFTVSAVA